MICKLKWLFSYSAITYSPLWIFLETVYKQWCRVLWYLLREGQGLQKLIGLSPACPNPKTPVIPVLVVLKKSVISLESEIILFSLHIARLHYIFLQLNLLVTFLGLLSNRKQTNNKYVVYVEASLILFYTLIVFLPFVLSNYHCSL